MIRTKKKSLLLFLGLILILALFSPGIAQELDTEAELARLRLEQDENNRQLAEAQDSLAILQDEYSLQESNFSWLLERDQAQRDLFTAHLSQMNGLMKIIQSLDKNLELAIQRYETKKNEYCCRVEAMYGLQDKSQLELLLESESLDGYFSTIKLMKMITDADEAALLELRAMRDDLLRRKEETNRQLAELEGLKQILQNELDSITADMNYSSNASGELGDALYQRLAQVAEYNAQDEAIRRSIEELEARQLLEAQTREQEAAQGDGTAQASAQLSGNGILLWPIPGNMDISSYFGSRVVPELGLNDFHTGLDFAADYGVPVYAAASGTVSLAGWIDYGGITVKINVGSGLDVMYCHLNDFAVSAGEAVVAGQLIGYVGSTGMSTGPHLHFEVQADGVSVDPLLYLN